MKPLLQVKNLKKHYPITKAFSPKQWVRALDGVSFELGPKQTLGIIGESGCGKSTLAKALMGVESPTQGQIFFHGDLSQNLNPKEFHQTIQMIFQDPYSSLNPRKQAWQLIAEPLFINTQLSKPQCYQQALKLMEKVGLRPELSHRYPHMFSGGQRQRIGIARALSLKPKMLICDEPVSALDVSIQAQVLNLLMELQNEMGLSYLFISHDLNVVKHLADKILIMYLGKIVEYGDREEIFNNPQHPYTKALMENSLTLEGQDQNPQPLQGEIPSPVNPPPGCAFHKRCPYTTQHCSEKIPSLETKLNRSVACLNLD